MKIQFKKLGFESKNESVLKGVQIAKIGPALGHYAVKGEKGFRAATVEDYEAGGKLYALQLTEKTLSDIETLGNSRSNGIKAHVNHSDRVEDIIGCWRDFRIDGDCVRADFHWLNTDSISDIKGVIESIATSVPDEIGVSISFDYKINRLTNETVEVRLTELKACDFVDEPAATQGLFSMDEEIDKEKEELEEEVDVEVEETDEEDVFSKVERLESEVSEIKRLIESLVKKDKGEEGEELEDDDKSKDEFSSKQLNAMRLEFSKMLGKLGIKKPLSPSLRPENPVDKMSFSQIVSTIQASEKVSSIEANKLAIERYPVKYQEYLGGLKK